MAETHTEYPCMACGESLRTDQTAQGERSHAIDGCDETCDIHNGVCGTPGREAQGEAFECRTCGHNALAYPVTEPDYCRSLGHDVRRVRGSHEPRRDSALCTSR